MRRAAGPTAVLACFGLLGAAPDPTVQYRLTPVLQNDALDHLRVELRFAGDADGVTDVRLPHRWAGYERLHEAVVEPASEGARLSRLEPGLLRLTHARSASVILRYQVRGRTGRVGEVDYRPDLDAGGFTVLGETVFAWPDGRLSHPARAELGPLPRGWRGASTLDGAREVAAVRESVAAAGRDVRVLTRTANGAPVRVALRGRFESWGTQRNTDAELADTLASLLAAQRELSREEARPFTAVFQALPVETGRGLRDGLGRGDGAAYFFSGDTEMLLARRIIAHETVHAWLPRRIGGAPSGAAAAGALWFTEGFADFVAVRALIRAGEDPRVYPGTLDLRVDPARQPRASNAELVEGYGSRPELFQAPYRRGHLLALLWDSRLRERTQGRLGVDDVLAAMRSRSGGGRTADLLFPAVYRELGGGDLSGEIAAHVRDGRPIAVPPALYGGCLAFTPRRVRAEQEDGTVREQMSDERYFSLNSGDTAAERARCGRMLFGAGYVIGPAR